MEEVNISETESRYYSDLFNVCDVEKRASKVPNLKATEMFRSANLENDILKQITTLSGISQSSTHMSRVQFYSCLKFIAAYQAGLPLRHEMLASTVALPLPKFSWKDSPVQNTETELNGRNDMNRSSSINDLVRENLNNATNSDNMTSTDSEVEQNDSQSHERRRHGGSPEAWSTASDSPTPTNSVTERPWAKTNLWHGLLCEEQRQLLGTEEESSDRHSSEDDNDTDLEAIYQITPEQREYYLTQFRTLQPDKSKLLSGPNARVFFEKSRIPVDELRHIWQLCDVTKDGALSLGEFTAAMHLVVLRRNNIPLPPVLPACLMPTLNETRPSEPLEADLLHLDDEAVDFQPNANDLKRMISSHIHETTVIPQSSSIPNKVNQSSPTMSNKSQTIHTRSNSNSPSVEPVTPPKQHKEIDWNNQSKEWTKFTESPTSNVSSPGPKPVNIDMQRTAQAVLSDPQILHPVPVRVTPIGVDVLDDDGARLTNRKSETLFFDNGIVRDAEASPKQINISNRDSLQNDLRAIQRPQPKKLPTKNVGAIPPPPQRESSIGPIEENLSTSPNKREPPLPPPRPHKHARSSSLDLDKLKLNAPVPPEVPPRVSPQMISQISLDAQLDAADSSFADFAHFPETVIEHEVSLRKRQLPDVPDGHTADESGRFPHIRPYQQPTSYIDPNADSSHLRMSQVQVPSLQSSQRSSAFEVYRKPTPREVNSPEASSTRPNIDYEKRVSAISETLRQVSLKQDRQLNDVVQQLKEQNSLLLKLCSDLSDELLTVRRQKEEIKQKLDTVGGGGASSSGAVVGGLHSTDII
ncbi:ralBP1-associated Eps domain-containing protein 1 isoform X2 [Bradysia coprophila]|uniref:ralBP1-associated Eps domain-containing protein 1 isoform X2 n=1 Tax=Bradysia coprophila TaxID=38358 RepID=UPI00187D8CAE|nr:ralBP1-associated Eps domain-containing protein 1 isoform X2 [Bradysia coprophila]